MSSVLAFPKRVNLFVILFLCHWALVGFPKIYFFGIPFCGSLFLRICRCHIIIYCLLDSYKNNDISNI